MAHSYTLLMGEYHSGRHPISVHHDSGTMQDLLVSKIRKIA